MRLSHHQITFLETPGPHLRVVPPLYSSLYGFSTDSRFLPHFVQQVEIHLSFFIGLFSNEIQESGGAVLYFHRNHGFYPIDKAEGCLMGVGLWGGMIRPYDSRDLLCPASFGLV